MNIIKKNRLGIFFLMGFFFLMGCDPVVIDLKGDVVKDEYNFTDTPLPLEKKIDFVDVDYDNLTKNMAIFYNFKTGVKQEFKSTFWDVAIVTDKNSDETDNFYVVTNSGDYGESVRIMPFASGKDLDDYKYVAGATDNFRINAIQQVSFKYDKVGEENLSPYQNDPDTGEPVANPIHHALINEKKYFLKIGKQNNEAKLYVIQFDKISAPAMGSAFTLNITPCLLNLVDGVILDYLSTKTVSGTISDDYSFNYIKVDGVVSKVLGASDRIPKKNDWHVLFARTNIYSKEMGEVFANDGIIGSSSILVNGIGGVKVAPLYGWDFPDVSQVPAANYFSREIDVIGHGYANPLLNDFEMMRKSWYYGINMPPTFYLSCITYVFQFQDGNYGKFRPGSFYGPDGQKFYVKFRYSS